MKAYNTNIYPVFEADQVLSQKELNNLASHLAEQDQITRKNLTGLGIVCGLELSFPTQTTLKIACGTAVTSLGFQINWKEETLSYYHDYELSEQFLMPDYIKEPHLDPIFKHANQYLPIKNCIELLPSDSNASDKKPIPNGFFAGKVFVLLLEVTLIDQKNCVTTNCDDKGKRIEFNVRPVLVPVNELNKALFPQYESIVNYSKIAAPRYNVPYKNIITGTDVLKGFEKIYDNNFLLNISGKINNIYQDFKHLLPDNPDFAVLQNAKNKIDITVNFYKSSSNVQYLWDWISDIAQTFNEITEFKEVNPAFCCIDETLFPFHVVLGTDEINSPNYRTPFYKTLNALTEENVKLKKLIFLFERLVHIINSFKIDLTSKIKVTPSVYGDVALSEKSIPFYYDEVLKLNKKWNSELTVKNQNDTILSYHSDKPNYTNKSEIKTPLLFDIEAYNFFRVEGHIGMNYKNAIKDINLVRDSYSLPFKITALNAVDFLNKEVDILKFSGRWDDLETDYDLARKRLFNITEFVINWLDINKNSITNLMTTDNIANCKSILSRIKNLLTNDLKEFLPNFKSFYEIFKQLNYVFLFHRLCIQFNNKTLSVIAEDLIDRLDDINELFLEDPFTVIYEEANLRWQKLYKDLFFSTFIKKHPGIEHKAGVTKGGTFVLVYVDTTIFKTKAIPVLHAELLNDVKEYKKNFDIGISDRQRLEKSVDFKDYKSQARARPRTSSIDKCKEESDNIKSNLLEVAKFNLEANYTAEMSGFIIENLKDVLQYEVNVSARQNPFQQIIIADFFLPYICCGDGNTMEVKIEVNESLSIALGESEYCNNDIEGDHEIIVKGKFGGVFSGDGATAVVNKGGKYYLNPNHISIRTPKKYSLKYDVEGETSNTVEFQIEEPSTLNWSASRNETDHDKYEFSNPVANDTHEYEIDFGDNTGKINTSEIKVDHTFEFNEITTKFTVSIKQLGEVCENTQTIDVEKTGDFNSPDFKENDFNIIK